MWLPAIVVTGCDSERGGGALPSEASAKVIIMGSEDSFVETRATKLLNSDGLGERYGDIYIRQREFENRNDGSTPVNVIGWGKYQASTNAQGMLEFGSASSDGTDVYGSELLWSKPQQAYVFQAVSVPKNLLDGTKLSGVEINMEGETDSGEGAGDTGGAKATGTVTFGGGKEALGLGLEYFVGGGVRSKSLVEGGQSVSMTLRRQVAKVLFDSISRVEPQNVISPVMRCQIIFPNLPSKATFNFDEFHSLGEGKPQFDFDAIPDKRVGDFVTLHPKKDGGMGVKLDWVFDLSKLPEGEKPALLDNTTAANLNILNSISRSAYLMPFKFWDDENSSYEEQEGFFIVKLTVNKSDGTGTVTKDATEENIYTGNLLGRGSFDCLRAGRYARVVLTLMDGEEAGGTGSIIVGWNVEAEADVPHHPVPGVYSEEEEIELLLKALTSGEVDDIPKTFYDDNEKVIRLFTNIDWSKVSITELKIPEDFVLDGQGYNIKLGDGVVITGKGKLQDIYINGELTSYDGTTTSNQ